MKKYFIIFLNIVIFKEINLDENDNNYLVLGFIMEKFRNFEKNVFIFNYVFSLSG